MAGAEAALRRLNRELDQIRPKLEYGTVAPSPLDTPQPLPHRVLTTTTTTTTTNAEPLSVPTRTSRLASKRWTRSSSLP